MAFKSDRPLFATADGRVVEEGDPDASVVIANRAGKEISEDVVQKYNLRGLRRQENEDEAEAAGAPTDGSEGAESPADSAATGKQARGDNKGLKGAENK